MIQEHDFSFEGLNVYQAARRLVKRIYLIQQTLPKTEMYALGDQLRRASVSIVANLAEGSGRDSVKEKARFIEISYGSLMEVYSELQLAADLGYITQEEFFSVRSDIVEISRMLSGLKRSFANHQPA